MAKKAEPAKKATSVKKAETIKKTALKTIESKKTVEKEKTKYSKKDLEEFKQIILDKLEKARLDLSILMEAYANNGENDINDTSPTFKVLEEGYQVMSKEENARLAMRQEKFIKSLEAALIRIENGTYGICRETGKLIPKERLRIVPHATLTIDAKMQQSKK